MLIRRIARPMLAAVFVAGGVETLRNPEPRIKASEPLVAKGVEALPDDVTSSVPTDADTLVKIIAGVQVGGGVLLAAGKLPRLSSLALATTLVPTTVAGHAFWEETDPAKKAAQRTQFIKNVSLMGGVLLAAVDTEGKPSLSWRGRKAAQRANQAVGAAVPFIDSNEAADNAKGLASRAAERGQELVHRVADSDTTKSLVEEGRKRGHELADTARDRGPVLAERARERGQGLAGVARERGQGLADTARDRGPVLAEAARGRGHELAETARSRRAAAPAQQRSLSRKDRKKLEKESAQLEKESSKLAKQAAKERKQESKKSDTQAPAALRDDAEHAQARALLARAKAERAAAEKQLAG